MNKKFKGELLDRVLQTRIPNHGDTEEFTRGYDAAMMEIARFVNGWKPEKTKNGNS